MKSDSLADPFTYFLDIDTFTYFLDVDPFTYFLDINSCIETISDCLQSLL